SHPPLGSAYGLSLHDWWLRLPTCPTPRCHLAHVEPSGSPQQGHVAPRLTPHASPFGSSPHTASAAPPPPDRAGSRPVAQTWDSTREIHRDCSLSTSRQGFTRLSKHGSK